MKRYHEEKHIFENRIKKYKDVNAGWRSCGAANNGLPYNPTKQDEVWRYRKTLRVGGCGRARCQVCHSDKYPKRIPTRKELQARLDDLERE